jgi:hypothetical protein
VEAIQAEHESIGSISLLLSMDLKSENGDKRRPLRRSISRQIPLGMTARIVLVAGVSADDIRTTHETSIWDRTPDTDLRPITHDAARS